MTIRNMILNKRVGGEQGRTKTKMRTFYCIPKQETDNLQTTSKLKELIKSDMMQITKNLNRS